MKIRVIVTGSTGMVGEGVLHQCLSHSQVEKVLVINRRPCQLTHPKLTEIIHSDFSDISSIESSLNDFNSCFFCLGGTSIGKKEEEYNKLTYDLTLNFATTLVKLNPQMIFCYVSAAGTDSSGEGKFMWARIKGKTENDLVKLPFKKVYLFRPGYIQPSKGMKNTLIYYKFGSWLYPLLRAVFPDYVCTLNEVGSAMINSVIKGYGKQILEVRDIIQLAK
ncbi:MAG: NAD-dependent epimerase/dehydratase family protein [Ignavibacteria bacterium]